jgi:hypothetical protein
LVIHSGLLPPSSTRIGTRTSAKRLRGEGAPVW